ncbi:MAG: hypothetical protein ACC645_13050, partial [Pirellulales bacterium]
MTAPFTRPITDTTQRFVLWCAEQLQIDVQQSDRAIRLAVPEDRQSSLGGRTEVAFATEVGRLEPDGIEVRSTADQPQTLPPNELLDWLVEQLRIEAVLHTRGVVHSRPRQQPESVHEISERLFSSYQIDEGRVHLGGCTLEDRPLARVTIRLRGIEGHALKHSFWHADGRPVPPALIDALRLDDLTPFHHRRNRATEFSEPSLDAILASARECCS